MNKRNIVFPLFGLFALALSTSLIKNNSPIKADAAFMEILKFCFL